MLKEFREFILRGNVVDLAVAVVIGAAFSNIVTALTETMITPLIAAIGGQPDFSAIAFTINNSEFRIGEFLNAVVSFLLVALVVFFLIVKPMNLVNERIRRKEQTPDPTTGVCNFCVSEIPLKATRCPHCTSENPLASTAG